MTDQVQSTSRQTTQKLKFMSAISLVIGCVIGSGVFVKPGKVLAAAGSSNMALLAWVLGGVISLAGGLTLAEIASRIPKTGGIYVYVEELFGKMWGFVCGWVQSVIYGPALLSALALFFASLFTNFFHLTDPQLLKPIALLVLFTLASISAISLRLGAMLQNLTTLIKLFPIFIIGVTGLLMGTSPIFGEVLASSPDMVSPAAGMGVAILGTLWAYDGWVQVSNLAGDLENPSKNLPKAIILGLVAVMGAYLLVNASLFHVLPIQEIATLNEKAASHAAEILFGTVGGGMLGLGILISILGALNGNVMTMTRIPYAMALRNAFPYPHLFSKLNPKTETPVNSIIFKVTVASIMIILLNPDRITDIAMFIMYLFYAAVFCGVILMRKRLGKPAQGSYRVPLYPIIPICATLGSLYICYSMAMQAPVDALVSLGLALLGVPLYFLMNGKKNTPQEKN